MSLTTRCPACATVFRVVPDQLKVSEGWVRCGRCSELFDARATLSPQVPVVNEVVASADSPDAPGAAHLPAYPAASESADPAQGTAPPGLPSVDAVEPTTQPVHTVDASPAEPVLVASPTAQREEAATDTREPAWIDVTVEAAGVSPVASAALDAEPPRERASGGPPVLDAGPVLDQVSFMRRARRHAFWRQPAVRAALVVLGAALAVTLGGQVAYQQRDELAQRVPALTPFLSALCQPLQCRIGPPRRIESITIEASAFTRLQPDAFRLQFTLANAASMPVALPALELTLTDTQDQAVIRRVLQPGELGPDAPLVLPAAGEWASAVTLTLSPAAASAVTGYRLLAFYP